jgi:arabinose-5-phosphate isomerase
MLKSLFATQKKYIDYFFDYLNMDEVEAVLQLFLSCRGILFFTGIGKSGIIAQKIAATLVSTGTKAMFLPPIDALHGDLGIVNKNDVFVMLSKSGESDELMQLIPFVQSKGTKIVAIVSNAKSRIAKSADHIICLPLERELCPFDLAPTTSTAIQLIFGDVLAVGLMKARNFSVEDYALNHPAGRIGKRTRVQVKDIMIQGNNIPLAYPQDKVVDVLHELSDKRSGCLIIVDEKKMLLGIFTDGDLRRALQKKGPMVLEEKIENIMTKSPRTIEPSNLAFEAMKLMESDISKPVMMLPVVEQGRVCGLIKMHDLIQGGL